MVILIFLCIVSLRYVNTILASRQFLSFDCFEMSLRYFLWKLWRAIKVILKMRFYFLKIAKMSRSVKIKKVYIYNMYIS